jgi:hypothetical protein
MKSKIAFLFVLFLAAIPARRADAKVETSTFRLRDKSLQANFFTSDGCYGIATYIRYAQSVTQQDGPPVVTPPLTSVEVTYTNGCTGETFYLTGGTNQQYVTIAGDLSRASLSAVVPVSDGVVNANVTVNVTWTANAPLQQAKDAHLTWDPVARTLTWERFDFRTRSADVAGTVQTVLPVQAGPTLFNLGEFPQGGLLGKDMFGTRTVTFLGRHN